MNAIQELTITTPAGLANERLARLAAEEYGLLDDAGGVKWAELRRAHPYLFRDRDPVPQGHAGAGTGAEIRAGRPSPSASMNKWIRSQTIRG